MAKVISKETLSVGILAVLAGLAAAFGVRSLMNQEEVVPPPPPPVIQKHTILLASESLPADRVVAVNDVIQVPMTDKEFGERFKDVIPEQVLTSMNNIVGRRLKEPIQRANPFLTTKFYLEGTGPSITGKLQPGFRAIRVEVSPTHDGGVQAGSYTDVYFRADARPAKGGQLAIPERTIPLLRHIEVLEAERPGTPAKRPGQIGAEPKIKPTLVTLAVPEDKAEVFGIIEGRGEVWLLPTPAEENAGSAADMPNAATLAELLGLKPPRVVPPPPPPFETAIYRAGRVEVNKFVDGKLVANHGREPVQVVPETVPPTKSLESTPPKKEQ